MKDSIWEADPEEAGRLIADQCESIWTTEGVDRRDKANAALTLYHGSSRYQFGETVDFFGSLVGFAPTGYNIIQAAVDTLTSQIVRNNVRPMFVTERGDSSLKEKAQGMGRVCESVFFESKIYGALGRNVARAGFLFDGAAVRWFPDYVRHRVGCRQVNAFDIHTLPEETEAGDPRQMWETQRVPRASLLADFADDATAVSAIKAAPTSKWANKSITGSDESDIVDVVEYWHLPSGLVDRDEASAWGKDGEKPEHDGIHVITVDGKTLLHEPWPFDYFPFSFFRPYRTALGMWSTGVPERLASAQILINDVNRRIDQIIEAHAVPKLIVWDQAKITDQKVTNGTAQIWKSKVQPSQAAYYLVPQAVPSELFNRINQIVAWAEKQLGLSEMSISAMKPKGVDHAPGLQHLADTESIRHTVQFREWEDFHTSSARIIVDTVRILAETDPKFSVMFSDSKQLKRIKWRDVDIEDEKWHLRVWPTNLMPQTPMAKLSYAIDMVKTGMFTQEEGRSALDFPDIEAITGDQTAATENIERLIEDARSGKSGATPEPYMNLALLKTQVVSAINRLEADREDDSVTERLRKLHAQVDDLIAKTRPPVPAMPPGPGAPQPAPPGMA